MLKKIKYKCKKCGWKAEIIEQWRDFKPKRCLGKINNKKCKTSFLKEPEALEIQAPAND